MKITPGRVRDYAMLVLGTAVLARELFWVPAAQMNLFRVGLGVSLLLGPAALLSWLSARTTQVASVPPSPSPESSSQSSPS